jgi:hypothetical protein
MTEDSTPPTAPPYAVVRRPGPGLATITDRRDGKTRLWSRTLGAGGARGRRLQSAPRRCANCGTAIRGPFYKPPQLNPAIMDRLCVACVEGDHGRTI